MTKTFGILTVFGLLVWLSVIGCIIYESCEYDAGFKGYVLRAAYSNSVESAVPSLDTAIAYLEDNSLTEGFTSILYRTADEDLGWYYENLRRIRDDLNVISVDHSLFEKNIVFLNLKAKLLGSGSIVAAPAGISLFPHNTIYSVLAWVSFLSFLGMLVCFGIRLDPY